MPAEPAALSAGAPRGIEVFAPGGTDGVRTLRGSLILPSLRSVVAADPVLLRSASVRIADRFLKRAAPTSHYLTDVVCFS
jgi:hypothetical protein